MQFFMREVEKMTAYQKCVYKLMKPQKQILFTSDLCWQYPNMHFYELFLKTKETLKSVKRNDGSGYKCRNALDKAFFQHDTTHGKKQIF